METAELERRRAGGGGGAVGWLVVTVLAVGIPVGYLVTAKAPTRPVEATSATRPMVETPASEYRLFADPNWNELRFQFRPPKTPATTCTESAWVLGDGPAPCQTDRDRVI